jgi:hypothetical protein
MGASRGPPSSTHFVERVKFFRSGAARAARFFLDFQTYHRAARAAPLTK